MGVGAVLGAGFATGFLRMGFGFALGKRRRLAFSGSFEFLEALVQLPDSLLEAGILLTQLLIFEAELLIFEVQLLN